MLKEQFKLLRDFLKRDLKKITMLCAAGMIAAAIVGYFIGIAAPDVMENVIESYLRTGQTDGVIRPDGSLSVFALLAHNWSVMLMIIGYGFVPFIFLSVVLIASNGILIGLTFAMYRYYSLPLIVLIAGIVPHGVFELTAFTLSAACGIYLCLSINRKLIRSPFVVPLTEVFGNILRVAMLLVAPLTAIAALIETYISPIVASLFH